ncbi:MAG TPA: TetR/AcrR family transcriptional regulator [Pseudonocardia sp.]|nr:TetR/AcrR family transcriptional regulator [Pseudonocardia sp.]
MTGSDGSERSSLIRRDTPMRAPVRPQRAPGIATRRRLLDAGRHVFARDGVSGAATGDIVAEAGVAPTALYHHFGSKAGLFLAVAGEVYELFIGGLRSALEGISDFDAALDALITRAGELHTGDPTIAPMAITVQLEVQRSATLRHELAAPLASFRELADDVAAMAPPELLNGRAPRSMALAITALMNGLCSLAATLHDPRAFVDVAQSLRGLVVR